jgi:hypothetical protein
MKRADKVQYKIKRAKDRRHKRIDELYSIKTQMLMYDITFEQARLKVRGNCTVWICEMRYTDCEKRGYCNGDC